MIFSQPSRPIRGAVSTMAAVLAAAVLLTGVAGDAGPAASAAGSPAASSAAANPDAYGKEIAAWRAERDAGLRKDEGWLALVGLFWLEEGDNRIGSDPGGRVVFPSGTAPAVAGTLVRHGETVTVRAEPGVGLTADGQPVTDKPLVYGQPGTTMLRLGSLSFFVIKRGDRLGVRVRDSKSPAIAAFRGLENYPADPSWRVVARFEKYPQPKPIPIANILGMTDDEPSPGTVVFEHGGKTYRLDALGDEKGLFLIFKDQTSGSETYGAGRFIDTDPPVNGYVVVDFNKSYNPPCAFTSFATCPLPPKQNRLAVAITAGEKKYGEGHPAS
jgi:uncharacterized protein (DUF1684 family)